jgi:hypothetical protein
MFLNILFAIFKGMLELDGFRLERTTTQSNTPLAASEKPCLAASTAKPCQPH